MVATICFSGHVNALESQEEKYVVGAFGCGLFSDFFCVLNTIIWCEKNNKIPVVYWDKTSKYYHPDGHNNAKNVWEYYFEPVSNLTYTIEDILHKEYWINNNGEDITSYKIDKKSREKISTLIHKYIKIKPSIQHLIDDFFQKNMQGKCTIGIHLRGTDKVRLMPSISVQSMIDAANRHADGKTQFFIASDDTRLFEYVRQHLKGPVIYYPAFRADTNQYEWWQYHPRRAVLGQEVLIEAILLSKCDLLLHSNGSNVSAAALFFNPLLNHQLIVR